MSSTRARPRLPACSTHPLEGGLSVSRGLCFLRWGARPCTATMTRRLISLHAAVPRTAFSSRSCCPL